MTRNIGLLMCILIILVSCVPQQNNLINEASTQTSYEDFARFIAKCDQQELNSDQTNLEEVIESVVNCLDLRNINGKMITNDTVLVSNEGSDERLYISFSKAINEYAQPIDRLKTISINYTMYPEVTFSYDINNREELYVFVSLRLAGPYRLISKVDIGGEVTNFLDDSLFRIIEDQLYKEIVIPSSTAKIVPTEFNLRYFDSINLGDFENLPRQEMAFEESTNSDIFEPIPGHDSLFLGREMTGVDSEGTALFKLVAKTFNWESTTEYVASYTHDILRPGEVIAGGDVIRTAYDPTALVIGDEIWVAFECYTDSLRNRGMSSSTCIGPLKGDLSGMILERTYPILEGGSAIVNDTNQHSASVPKLLRHKGRIYLYWTSIKINSGGDWQYIITRGIELQPQVINGEELIYPKGFSSAIQANDPSSTIVYDIGDGDCEVDKTSGIVHACNNRVADVFDVISDGEALYITAAIGGGKPVDGSIGRPAKTCLNPLSPDIAGCYRLAISKSFNPLRYNSFKDEMVADESIPDMRHEYSKLFFNPIDNHLNLMLMSVVPFSAGLDFYLNRGLHVFDLGSQARQVGDTCSAGLVESGFECVSIYSNIVDAGDLKLFSNGVHHFSYSTLVMQSDGNLVLLNEHNQPLWNSATVCSGCGNFVDFQSDGNLVVYNGNNVALWSSGTHGVPEAKLIFDNDRLLIKSGDITLWDSSNSTPITPVVELVSNYSGIFTIETGHTKSFQDTYLAMQTDGNLVLYSNDKKVLWANYAFCPAGLVCDHRVEFQSDGNFVVYSESRGVVWHAGSFGATELVIDGSRILLKNGTDIKWDSSASPSYTIPYLLPSYSCLGTIPTSATMCSSDEEGLTSDVTRLLVPSCTSTRKCEYTCNSDTTLTDGQCIVPISNSYQIFKLANGESKIFIDAHLDMQTDGNLVLYKNDQSVLWATYSMCSTNVVCGDHAEFQSDGNFVLYSENRTAVWHAGSFGGTIMSFEGSRIVIKNGTTVIWSSN